MDFGKIKASTIFQVVHTMREDGLMDSKKGKEPLLKDMMRLGVSGKQDKKLIDIY